MDCSIKNNSLRNLINDDYLYTLWSDYTALHTTARKEVVWNIINKQHFFIEFRKTINLEQIRLMKLRDYVLKLNKMLYEWEEQEKIQIVNGENYKELRAEPYKVLWE
tara:strand:+ start:722 stop:1042 length:321 start_codon:yes stop_codon:yes gene_type:complete